MAHQLKKPNSRNLQRKMKATFAPFSDEFAVWFPPLTRAIPPPGAADAAGRDV